MRDVAVRAGVSVKTVSNVVNGTGRVGVETRTHIQQLIGELGYRPNMSARHLRRARSGVIAFAVPEISNPYHSELAELIVKEAEQYGWTVLIDQTDGDPEREHLVLEGIRAHLIDGLLFIPRSVTAEDIGKRIDRTPIVLLGQEVTRIADRVAIDSYAAGRAATEHLLELGRRQIGLVGPAENDTGAVRGWRFAAYRDALADAGIRFDCRLVAPSTRWRQQDGIDSIESLFALSRPPDALFCGNDLLAHGVMFALRTKGIRVPDDVAVVGMDDVVESRFSTPTLSSIAPDKEHLARAATELLAERLDQRGKQPGPREVVAAFRLIARESTLGRQGG